ncbi:MAG: DUF488 domain-containing protein [Planctomycetota bacterium]|nr:DUF488 domain-containing protein [Planctomycetota bacterium]
MTIYTLGYSGWKIDDIRATVDRLDAVLVDVRMVPRSRVPQWSCYSLSREFGHRYAWVRELGNENYKGTFEQIKIANFPAGEKRLRELLALSAVEGASGGRAIILLCGCKDVTQCHRKLLAERLAEAWSADVVHLTPPAKPESPGQARLC